MNQIFHPSMNTISRVSIFGALFFLIGLGAVIDYAVRSPYFTDVGIAVEQPVPFSHWHHVDQLGIDCRYCHISVDEAAYAGIPPTETCMTCHSQVWSDAPMLEPVRESFRTGEPLRWNKVHDLSDFVYFDHSVHVNAGVGCESCHGRVDRMPLVAKANTLHMEWCLECHRDPAENLRPAEEIYTFGWERPTPGGEGGHEEEEDGEGHGETEAELPDDHAEFVSGQQLVADYGIEVGRLDDCSICHR